MSSLVLEMTTRHLIVYTGKRSALNRKTVKLSTVLSAKSQDVMFCLQSYQDLEPIDHLCINPIRRINTQVIC